MAEFENFGFYTTDADYFKFLNRKDSEVYYNSCPHFYGKYTFDHI